MADCPECGRPVAMARATCLYCGAPLPETALPRPSAAEPEEPQAAPRMLLVGELSGADPERLAGVLGVSVIEAGQRVRREGPSLLRVLPAAEAEAERERLAACGARVRAVAEEAVRRGMEPWVPLGGGLDESGRLRLRAAEEQRSVSDAELLLVVQGRIHREYQPDAAARRKLRTATLEQGYRVHLHTRDAGPPIELDPGGLEFDDQRTPGSSLLRIRGWLERVAAGVPVDDAFRFLPPALGPEQPPEGGALAATRGLRGGVGREESPILDNLRQFRYYSAWRGAWERAPAD